MKTNITKELLRLGGLGKLTAADIKDFDDARMKILRLMADGQQHSATEIIAASGQREGLRRLRDLREFGFEVCQARRPDSHREWIYWLAFNSAKPEPMQPLEGLRASFMLQSRELAAVALAASEEEDRPAINAVQFCVSPTGVVAVATNRRVLLAVNLLLADVNDAGDAFKVSVHRKAISVARKRLAAGMWRCEVYAASLKFTDSEGISHDAVLTSGFPDWNKVLPKTDSAIEPQTAFDAGFLKDLLGIVELLTVGDDHAVMLSREQVSSGYGPLVVRALKGRFFGMLMPMRTTDGPAPLLPDWLKQWA